MMIRRIICYLILILLEFFIGVFFILILIRYSYNTQGSDGTGYREFLYWLMRVIIVLLNIIVAFLLVPNTSRKFRLVFGFISGIGFQVYLFILSEIFREFFFTVHISNSAAVVSIAAIFIFQIICLELAVRIKMKMQLKNIEPAN